MKNHIYQVDSYIIRHKKYRESSLILDIFTKDFGLISLIAKGLRGNKKKNKIGYNLHQKYHISWIHKSTLGILTEIEIIPPHVNFLAQATFTGFYMNELILKLLHKHEPHARLFKAYEQTLERLTKDADANEILRYFEKELLISIGYGLNLKTDIDSLPIKKDKNYYYYCEQGLSLIERNNNLCRISGHSLIALDQEKLVDQTQMKEAKTLLTKILMHHLHHKPLKSKLLYQKYINTQKSILNKST